MRGNYQEAIGQAGARALPGIRLRRTAGRGPRSGRRALGLVLFLAAVALGAETTKDWLGGYNSREAGLEESLDTGRGKRVYTLHNLETLRRGVRPRYVRVISSQYAAARPGQTMMQKGILFTYASYRSRRVYLSGDFNNWGLTPMRRNRMGVYYHILPVREIEDGKTIEQYRYKFQVDGIWVYDPTHPNRQDDGLGGYLSTYVLDDRDVDHQVTVSVVREKQPGAERLVEFAIYLPDVENLSLVGDFNEWNPEHDLMVKGADGVFRLRLRLRPGAYTYKYVADGKWMLDRFNENTRFHSGIGELCSYLELR